MGRNGPLYICLATSNDCEGQERSKQDDEVSRRIFEAIGDNFR